MISPINSMALLIVSVLFSFCGIGTTNSRETVDFTLLVDSVSENSNSVLGQVAQNSLVLYEKGINNLILPLERREVLPDLKNTFPGLMITKEIGQQDGPDFPLYSIKDENGQICFFAMDSEDTLKLTEVYIKTPLIKDQYGLRVGDDYQKIKSLRQDNAMTSTDLHHHTLVYFDNSNIQYEISGDISLPDTVDFDNLKFTEAQIKDWVIERLIWRE